MGLLEFRSPAAGGFFMMPDTFRAVCKVLDKDYAAEGCWLPEDLPKILQLIEQEVAREKVLLEAQKAKREERERAGRSAFLSYEEEEEEKKLMQRVSFAMRVFPLTEMLRAAIKKKAKVMWGVPY